MLLTKGFIEKDELYYEQMIGYIAKGCTVSIDVGNMTATQEDALVSRYFFNEASFGISSAIADSFNQSTWLVKLSKDWTVFLLTIWQQFVYKNKYIEMEFTYKDGTIQKETHLQQVSAICNGKYFANGMPIQPQASIIDQQFHCCIVGVLYLFFYFLIFL